MKRIAVVIAAVFCLLIVQNALALDTKLFEMRSRLLEESRQLKGLIPDSKDAIVLISLWDSCLMTITQLNAYFNMLSLFNSIPKDSLTREATATLTAWLLEIKTAANLHVQNMDNAAETVDEATRAHLGRLKAYFTDLGKRVEAEMNKVSLIQKSLKEKK